MKIAVSEIGRTFGPQTRAYAEYRVFSSLARFSHDVSDVAVTLSLSASRSAVIRCGVSATLDDGRSVCITARGRHVYDAINRAAGRIADAVERHNGVAQPS